jgi:ribonuclease HII
MKPSPTFDCERQYWQQDILHVAGVDEAGMGCLAGPVCAAAVVFDYAAESEIMNQKLCIRDSKQLSAKKREAAAEYIKEHALVWAVGEASVKEITKTNIRAASHLAMKRAVNALATVPQLLLIDGTPAQPHSHIPAVNIIDGDALSFSIAAASILAKVHRDYIMINLDKEFPHYGFASHKGYGSKAHLEALSTHGVTPHHRTTYAPVAQLLTKNL